jgi:hypothetical protein
MGINWLLSNWSTFGRVIFGKIPTPSAIENTIRTGSGTILEPKKGEAIKNAPTRKDEINSIIKYKEILCKSSPGNEAKFCI